MEQQNSRRTPGDRMVGDVQPNLQSLDTEYLEMGRCLCVSDVPDFGKCQNASD